MKKAGIQTFEYGDDIGFEYTDFIYPNELIANAGDNICTAVLDKIVSMLGNYEYFYDVFGNFVFQEIKNYLNTTQATVDIENMKNKDYQIDISKGKAVYDFKESPLINSLSNDPQYNRIKNDFMIWGARKTSNDMKFPIRYHLAIDEKPKTGEIFNVYFYTDPEDNLVKAQVPLSFSNKSAFPEVGDESKFYLDLSTNTTYKWNPDLQEYVSPSGHETLEYPSYQDFPSNYEDILEDTIYKDLNTGLMYMWLPKKGQHFDDVQEEIDTLTEQYKQTLATKENVLEGYQNDLAIIERQIQDLQNNFVNPLDELQEANNNKNALSDNIEYNTQTITDNEALITQYETLISYYDEQYEILINQAIQETDPDRKAELEDQAQAILDRKNLVVAEVENLEENNNNLQAQIDSDEDLLNYWEQKITDVEAILETQGYYDSLDDLEDMQEATQNLIDGVQEEINTLTDNYNENLSDLKHKQKSYVKISDDGVVKIKTTDWRSQLYLQGAVAESLGLESNPYYVELQNEWPKLYDLKANSYEDEHGNTIYTGAFKEEVLKYPWDLDYWLDFIDTETAVGALSVKNIGRRSLSENKDEYNCLFEPEVPDFILIESGQPDTDEKRDWCIARSQKYIQVDSEIYNQTAAGGSKNSCFERVKNALYDYTAYNNSISISCLPIYHLDVNKRISITNKQSDIYGDYLTQSISIPLSANGIMNIAAIKCNAKL